MNLQENYTFLKLLKIAGNLLVTLILLGKSQTVDRGLKPPKTPNITLVRTIFCCSECWWVCVRVNVCVSVCGCMCVYVGVYV